MPYSPKVVLHCPDGLKPSLDSLVEDFIRDGVIFVGVVGKDCSLIEDIIDQIVVRDGDRNYALLTSSHADETLDDAFIFARSLTAEFAGEAQLVML